MLNDYLAHRAKSFDVYFANDERKFFKASEAVMNDLLHKFECNTAIGLSNASSNLTSGLMSAILVINSEFTKSIIAKGCEHLTANNLIRIVIEDKYGCTFDHVFVCVKAEKQGTTKPKYGTDYKLYLEEIYAYYFKMNSPANEVKTYKGLPISIAEQILLDVMKTPDEILRSYGLPTQPLEVIPNTYSFMDAPKETTYKVTRNMSAMEACELVMLENNILLYQTYNGFKLHSDFSCDTLEPRTANDGAPLWVEGAPSDYAFRIHDMIKSFVGQSDAYLPKLRVTWSAQGKSQTTIEIKPEDIAEIITLNNKPDEITKKVIIDEATYDAGQLSPNYVCYLWLTLLIKFNNLALYHTGPFNESLVGLVTTTSIASNSGYAADKLRGDQKFSGNWLIWGSSFSILSNGLLFGRLVLLRFDNPDEEETLTEAGGETGIFKSSKPPIPNISREPVTEVSNTIQEFRNSLKEMSESFISKINIMTNQVEKISNYADEKTASLTAPIKQFTNEISQSEIGKETQKILRNNRMTLGIVNNIVANNLGVNIISGVNETLNTITNLDSIVKEATIGQVEKIANTLTSQATSVVNNVTSAVQSMAASGQKVIAELDKTCENIADCELNIDQGIKTALTIVDAVENTQKQVENIQKTVENVKKTVENIPDTIKLVNPLEDLKKRRERILRSFRQKQ